jgi:molecular chaperone DnaK
MVDEAKAHADEDKKKRDVVEAKNKADTLTYSSEKLLRDLGDKAPADLKTKIEDQVKVVRKAAESDDAEAINKEVETLQNLQNELSQQMYSQAGAGAGPGAGPGGQQTGPGGQAGPDGQEAGSGSEGQAGAGSQASGGDDEDVIDAEFEAKDEK